jgi:hypothetical protein
VNAAGLVEVVPYNLLQYSEQFNDAIWVKQSGSSITANTTTAPDGTTTADTLTISSGQYLYQNIGANIGVTYTISIYVRVASGTNQFKFNVFGAGNNFMSSTLTATTTWQRFEYTFTATGTGVTGIYPILVDGLAGGNFFIWGGQVNEGSLKDYLPTTTRLNIARIDYSTGSPALLVEPQRTNILTYSSEISNWLNAGGSVTTNTAIAPDGTMTADTLTGLRYQGGLGTNVFTFSCYAKKFNGDNKFVLRIDNPSLVFAQFDLNNGTIDSVSSGYTATITQATNGWYRCTMTSNASIEIYNAVIQSASGGSNSTYVWGAQLEVGSYPTSYIPTTSASVTRNADVVSKTGITSLIGQTEGTLFYEGSKIGLDTSEFYLSDGTYDNHIRLQYFSNTNIIFGVLVVGGAAQCVLSTSAFTVSDNLKIAFKYKANDFALWVNGTEVATDTSGTTFAANTLNRINLGQPDNNAAGVFKGNVKALSLWKTALTNAQLAELTTL